MEYSSARCCYVGPLPPSDNSSRMTRSDDSASPFSKLESRDPTTATSEANGPRGRWSRNRLTELAAFTVFRNRVPDLVASSGRTTQTHDGERSSAATSARHGGSSAGSSGDDAASPINPRQEEAENAHTAAAAAATAPCRLKFAKHPAYWFCTCFFE